MQALKSLVILMGVLIAIGVTVIGVTIYRRATDMASDKTAAPAGASAPSSLSASAPSLTGQSAAAANFGMRSLDLPPGSLIISVQPFDSRVLAHVRLPDGGASILLLDPATGDIAGEWRAFGGGAEGTQVPTRPRPAQR